MSRLSITTADPLHNPHPGEILTLEFLEPMGVSAEELASALHMQQTIISEILHGQRAITADADLRLARYFGVSEGMFLTLQADYDLLKRKRELGPALQTIRPRAA